MKQFITTSNQHGFAALHLVAALVIMGSIGFVGGNVYNAQKKNKELARAAAVEKENAEKAAIEKKTAEDAEKKTVEIPAAEAEKKIEPTPAPTTPKPATTTTTPKPTTTTTYTKFDIPSASSQVNTDTVVVTASLGKAYSGVCAVSVYAVSPTATFMGDKTSLWYEANFSNQSNCTLSIPKEKLTGTGTYKFQMYYVDSYSNKTLKGTSAYYNFVL